MFSESSVLIAQQLSNFFASCIGQIVLLFISMWILFKIVAKNFVVFNLIKKPLTSGLAYNNNHNKNNNINHNKDNYQINNNNNNIISFMIKFYQFFKPLRAAAMTVQLFRELYCLYGFRYDSLQSERVPENGDTFRLRQRLLPSYQSINWFSLYQGSVG